MLNKRIIVSLDHAQVSESDLTEFVNSRVASHKRIRGGITFVDSLPRNSLGKLLRDEMKEWIIRQRAANMLTKKC